MEHQIEEGWIQNSDPIDPRENHGLARPVKKERGRPVKHHTPEEHKAAAIASARRWQKANPVKWKQVQRASYARRQEKKKRLAAAP